MTTITTESKIYTLVAARMIAGKATKRTGVAHEYVAVGEDQYIVQAVAVDAPKATKITLHINTGEKREDGKNKQLHVVLWNRPSVNPDQFFGGSASVVDGKLSITTVQAEGEEFPQVADPYALFVNRAKTTGRVLALALMQNGNLVGEIKFKKAIKGKTMLSGTHNHRGIQFDDKYHVVSEENNRAIFGDIVGGLKDDVLAGMIAVGAIAAASNDDSAKVAA